MLKKILSLSYLAWKPNYGYTSTEIKGVSGHREQINLRKCASPAKKSTCLEVYCNLPVSSVNYPSQKRCSRIPHMSMIRVYLTFINAVASMACQPENNWQRALNIPTV